MDPQFLSKGKYPEPKKNFFETSKDSFSRARLETLLDVYEELKSIFPDIDLAFSLVGSLAKGRKLSDKPRSRNKAEDSDIDLAVLYDSDKVKTLLKRDPKYYKLFNLPENSHYFEVSNAFYEFIKNFIYNKMLAIKETGIIKKHQISIEFCPKKLAYDFEDIVSVYRFLFGRDIGGGLRKYIVGFLLETKKLDEKKAKAFWDSLVLKRSNETLLLF
jgi:predicted nucleotidyltransferase